MSPISSHFRSILVLILPVLTLFACAANIDHYPIVNNYLLNQNYDAALSEQRKNKENYAKRNRVLYYLDEGLLSHFTGNYQESNASLLKAEGIMADLYTRSISKEAASFLINDNTISYRGEDFEAALVNLFLAINFVKLGKLDEALVEARKVDSKLNSFNLQYPAGKKNVYQEDAFIRYFMGILYLAGGEINDALISFRKAEQIYRRDYRPNYGVGPPQMLIEDLLWAAKKMNFKAEYQQYKKLYRKIEGRLKARDPEEAQVYFIHYNGLGAQKVERSFTAPMPDGYVVRLAYPEFVKRNFRVDRVRVSLGQIGSGKHYNFSTHVMEDISAIAIKNLKNRIGRITAKAVARVTTKYLLAKKAEEKALKDGDEDLARILRFTFQLYLVAFEVADTRHWRLLPAKIQIGRSFLPSGRYRGSIQLLDHNGTTIASRPVAPFSLTTGETKLVILQTLE